jgi:malic enzyme
MFHRAALTLAAAVPDSMLARGSVYPSLKELQTVSLEIAVAVAREAYRLGIATAPEPADLSQAIREYTWQPEYRPLD